MSKCRYRQSNIYLPGTDIPVNRLDITDAEVLREIESELLEQAYVRFIEALTADTRFDEAYFRDLQRLTFGSLYDWAGQYRYEDMLKGTSVFCRGAFVDSESHRIFGELERENFLRGAGSLPLQQFAERLAYFQSELIALHPFYELNGRTTRLFFDLIAIHNGYGPIDYELSLADDPEVGNNYIRASIACVRDADFRPLHQLVLTGLREA